ncbi:MAG: EamA family transporter, partial [Pseudomonadota bacterium]
VNAVVLLQVIGFGIWFVSSGAAEQPTVRAHWRPSLFVGITSAVGSIGWFTAMTLVNAAYVKAVGQIEAVFALAISAFYFRERVSRTEMVGMALIVASVLVFLL